MPQAVPIVLACWVPATLLLFRTLRPSRALVAALLGGWLLLPTARFDDSARLVEFPYWILPASLPSPPWWTKAIAIPLAALAGVLASDRKALLRFRPSWYDLPLTGWVAWPLVSCLANGLGARQAAFITSYQAVAWGVPYFLGRVYFADAAGRDDLARGLVVAGLLYAPLCLIEGVVGPWLYATLYGFHPYRSQGAVRYLGYRPVVFLEDGNQLGIWLASSAMSAAVLWRSGRLGPIGRVPGGAAAGGLVALAILSQSAGAVLLLMLGLAAFEVALRSGRIWPLLAPLALLVAALGVRAVNLVDAKALAQKTAAGRAAIAALYRLDRQSLGWRMRVEERGAKVALERPVAGWGRWDWWRGGEERPWGLPGLALGMYGLPGWAFLMAALAAPIARFLVAARPASWTSAATATAAALAAVLTINALDSILNGAYLMPLAAASGGLAGFRPPPPPRRDPATGHLVVKLGR